MSIRIGNGYDVHRLVPGRALVLGGVEIPHSTGLLGHSDADVLTHAIIDALLGAAGMGDIGKLFPDTDAQYKGADSTVLLTAVCKEIRKKGCEIINIDSIIVAQAPKLAPFMPQMLSAIAKAAGTTESQINIKATTEEHLGFTGSAEGMAAYAVCLIDM